MMGHYQPPVPQAIPLPPLAPAVPIFELSEVEQRDLVALLTHLHALNAPPPGDKAPESPNPSIVSQAKVSQGGSLCLDMGLTWAGAAAGTTPGCLYVWRGTMSLRCSSPATGPVFWGEPAHPFCA